MYVLTVHMSGDVGTDVDRERPAHFIAHGTQAGCSEIKGGER